MLYKGKKIQIACLQEHLGCSLILNNVECDFAACMKALSCKSLVSFTFASKEVNFRLNVTERYFVHQKAKIKVLFHSLMDQFLLNL